MAGKPIIHWKVWYDHDRTYTSADTAWEDLPAVGFQMWLACRFEDYRTTSVGSGGSFYWFDGEFKSHLMKYDDDGLLVDYPDTVRAELQAKYPKADFKAGTWMTDEGIVALSLELQADQQNFLQLGIIP